jgi:hypothetical protein
MIFALFAPSRPSRELEIEQSWAKEIVSREAREGAKCAKG